MVRHSRIMHQLKEIMHKLKPYRKSIVFIVVLIVVGLGYWRYRVVSEREALYYNPKFLNCEYDTIQNPKNSGELCMITNVEDYAITREYQNPNNFIADRYVTVTFGKGWKKTKWGYSRNNSIVHFNKYNVQIYDLIDKKVVETVDIKALIKPYEKEWQLAEILGRVNKVYMDENGNPMIAIPLDRIIQVNHFKESRKYPDYRLIYNWETGKTDIINWQETYTENDSVEELEKKWNILEDPYFESFLEVNGFYNSDDFENKPCMQREDTALRGQSGYMILHVSAWALPEDNVELYSRFPGLEEYKNAKDKIVTFFLPDYPRVEVFFPLLVEAEQGVSFENVILKEGSAIDGQEHEIHSFEEYYQWRK